MPAIWLIDAYRAGERGQVRALAERLADELNWPCRTLTLRYRRGSVLPHILGQTTLAGISAHSRLELRAPWPGLVITSGVRNEPVCRWIRAASGGRTRYIHVGRPWGPLSQFDLVVTTPQYHVPKHPAVLHNELTLHGLDTDRLETAARQWSPVFADLPRPWIGVLAGGDSGPFTFGERAASRLARQASRLARERGGSLLVTTSARTRPAASRVLETDLASPRHLHVFGRGDAVNPYPGILALADEFIVTGDSIAMISEACATGRPVSLFDLGGMREGFRHSTDPRLGATLYAGLMRWLPARLSRDIALVHHSLVENGRARWLDDAATVQSPAPQPPRDMERTVLRVRRMLESE